MTPSGGRFAGDAAISFLTAVPPPPTRHAVGDTTMWQSRLANGIGGRYGGAMAKKPPPWRRTASTSGPFFDLLDQMEALTITVELDWPEDIRADSGV
jgi:hypothetical protein